MSYDPTAYAREQAATQEFLNRVTRAVEDELRKLGIGCAIDTAKSEGNPDALFINCGARRLNIRAHIIGYGAKRDRIEWHGYAHRRDHHSSDVPRLAETTSAKDAPASRIAKQILSKIIEPAAEPIERYNSIADRWDAARAELPRHVETVRKMGFNISDPKPGATEAEFYISGRKGISGTVRINSDGGAYLDRLSLDPETARCVLEFLAVRPKG